MRKSSKHKIVIVGNCQARPIQRIINLISEKAQVIGTLIVHLLNDESESESTALLDQADTIATQIIADNYPCKYLQTRRLKSDYPGKVVTFLNLFFTGYTPDWLYVRLPAGKGTLKGPMGDYHNRTIIHAWLIGKSVDQTTKLLFDTKFNQDMYGSNLEIALNEFNRKEKDADIIISEFIINNMKNERLFFTFNHPSLFLLREYSQRILKFLDIPYSATNFPSNMQEPLNQFIPPLNPVSCYSDQLVREFKGVEVMINNGEIITKGSKIYSSEEIINIYYAIYKHNEDLIMEKYGT